MFNSNKRHSRGIFLGLWVKPYHLNHWVPARWRFEPFRCLEENIDFLSIRMLFAFLLVVVETSATSATTDSIFPKEAFLKAKAFLFALKGKAKFSFVYKKLHVVLLEIEFIYLQQKNSMARGQMPVFSCFHFLSSTVLPSFLPLSEAAQLKIFSFISSKIISPASIRSFA